MTAHKLPQYHLTLHGEAAIQKSQSTFTPAQCGLWDLVMALDIHITDGEDMEAIGVIPDTDGVILDTDGAILFIGDRDGDIPAIGDLLMAMDTDIITIPIITEEEDLLLTMAEEITRQTEAIAQIEVTTQAEAITATETTLQTEVTIQTDKTPFQITEEDHQQTEHQVLLFQTEEAQIKTTAVTIQAEDQVLLTQTELTITTTIAAIRQEVIQHLVLPVHTIVAAAAEA